MDDLKEQLRQAEQREAQLRNRVEELSREIEDLSYAISHDLRAPLRAIHGFTRVLQEDYQKQLEGEGERYLGIVMSSARLMSEMIEGMLAISRATKQPMLSVEIPMQRLVEDVVHVVFCPPRQRHLPPLARFLHVAVAAAHEPLGHVRFLHRRGLHARVGAERRL